MNKRSEAAHAAFRARLTELDATLLEENWLGSLTPHKVRCAAGHVRWPRPANVQQGHGICGACAGTDTDQAEADFRARLDELGATLLQERWLGSDQPHRVRCAAGHERTPTPSSVQRGRGVCITCSRQDPAAAELAFRERLTELGATLLEERWLGSGEPHRVLCTCGQVRTPRPKNVAQGHGICRPCSRP